MDRNFRKPFLLMVGFYFVVFIVSRTVKDPAIQIFVTSVGVMILGLAFFVFEYLSESGTMRLMVGWLLLIALGLLGVMFSLNLFSGFSAVMGVIVLGILVLEGYIFYTSPHVYPEAEPEEN